MLTSIFVRVLEEIGLQSLNLQLRTAEYLNTSKVPYLDISTIKYLITI